MPRKLGVLAFACGLLAMSYVVGWYGTGGAAPQLSLASPDVRAALAYFGDDSWSSGIVQSAELKKAWLSVSVSGHKVNVGMVVGGRPYLGSVSFDAGGTPIGGSLKWWAGALMPEYLRPIAYGFFVLWALAAFVAPHVFGVKCPDCPQSFISPVLTEVQEKTMYPGGVDASGFELPGIIRRDFVCPRCGYRKVTYATLPMHSGGLRMNMPGFGRPSRATLLLNPKELDWYERVMEKWYDEHAKTTRFKTLEDWDNFYNELKATEREDHGTQG